MSTLLEVLEQSRDLGFLGPGPVADHVTHAEAFVSACTPPPSRFLDLGSGGGVPGLILAVTWADARGVLLDSQLRRVRFLSDALEALDCAERVVAVHGRAEELARDPRYRAAFDVVTARSFGPPGVTAESAAGFLVPGGALVVSEPPVVDAARWPAAGLSLLGLSDAGALGSVRVLRSVAGPLDVVPRRAAALARSPRF